MRWFFTLFLLFLFSFRLQATEYVKIWVNDEESSSVTQGDQFAWEFDVSVNGGTGNVQIIFDVNENESYDAGDVVLIEFPQTDGVEGNDGPGDGDGEENGVVYSPLGPFGFAPGYYIFQITDENDQSQASASFHVSALASPAATIHGNISKADVAPPSTELANIMIIAQLDQGFAGFWTGLTDNQGNYSINLPDTAIGTVWNIELFSDNYEGYIVNDHYEEITIHAGANTGFNFHFNKPSSYVYGRLVDDNATDIILDDYIYLENTNTQEEYYSEIIAGKFNIPVTFEPGKTSAQFRIGFWGENFAPDYMIPYSWNNEDLLITVNEHDSLEKNIIIQRSDEEIYVQITMEDTAPGMIFEVEAYDDKGYTRTRTDDNGWGILSVKGTQNYSIMIRFDDDDLQPLPPGYTFEAGVHSNGVAGDTVKFNIVGATSSIAGSVSFDENDAAVPYNLDEFFVELEEQSWSSTIRADIDEAFNYRFDLSDGTYNLWFINYEDDFLAMPNRYENIVLESDTVENLDFELNYRHANVYVTLKNTPFNPQGYFWNIYTRGEPPYIYETWTSGNADSVFQFRVCDGEWHLQPPLSDTSLAVDLSVSNDAVNYYITIDYLSKEITTGLNRESELTALKYNLRQNFPNPFNPTTTIDYQLAKNSKVSLTVYDIVGREVKTLVDESQGAGKYSIKFDASDLPSGLYFYRLQTSGGFHQTRKMLLVK